MTTTRTKTLLVAGFTAVGGSVLAVTLAMAHGPDQNGRADFDTLDADGDGMLTAAELDNAKAARLGEIDTNGDGFISVDEMIALMLARNTDRIEARFEKLLQRADANGDGLLSIDELGDVRGRRAQDTDAAGLPCLLYTSPSPRDQRGSRMPSSA